MWTDDEELGVVKMPKQLIEKTRFETKREAHVCTSCSREKQSSDFDEGKKTCRACLDAGRLRSARVSHPARGEG